MSINRRQFLKIAGISTVLGLGSTAVINSAKKGGLEASTVSTDPAAIPFKRWGMVVDMSKFKTADDRKKVYEACHSIHNVPDLGNPKDEVKWIWEEKFEAHIPG